MLNVLYGYIFCPTLLIGLIVAKGSLSYLSLRQVCIISSGILVLMGLLCYKRSSLGLWSPSFIYFFIFSLFHFGLILVIALSLPLSQILEFSLLHYWPSDYLIKIGVYLVTFGLISFIIGLFVGGSFPTNLPTKRNTNIDYTRADRMLGRTGFVLLATSVPLWFFFLFRAGGFAIFFGAYSNYYGSLGEHQLTGSVAILYFTIQLGIILAAASSPSTLKRLSIYIFILFAVIAFQLGVRGSVLFPLSAAITVHSLKQIPYTTRKAILVALTLLCAIAFIGGIRQTGFNNLTYSDVSSFSPHHAVAELGGQLRVVSTVYSWIETGDELLYGGSFWAPIDRSLYHIIPFWDRPPAREDMRLSNVLVRKRGETFGFSPIAEGLRNFGSFGVFFVMFTIGIILSRLDLSSSDCMSRAYAGVIMIALLIFVRNSFTPVPAQIFVGLCVLLIIGLFSRKINRMGTLTR